MVAGKTPHGWIFGQKKKKTRQGSGRFTKHGKPGSKNYKKAYIGQGR